MIQILIADDERPARLYLRAMLDTIERVKILGEAENGEQALELSMSLKPDLLLLDLQMPLMGGLEVVRHLPDHERPLVIFVTAFDEYAVKAFEVDAVDYLLKPVEKSRLQKAVARAVSRLQSDEEREEASRDISRVTEHLLSHAGAPYIKRIPVRVKSDIVFIDVHDLASVVAEGELLHLITKGKARYLVSYRLKDLEGKLDPQEFVRISRGALVNVGSIQRVSPMPGGTYLILLTNGQELQSSRSRSRILRETLLKI